MADQEHLAKLREGPEAWNRWRKEHADVAPNLSEANLSEADLSKADFNRAILSGADLHEADLYEPENL
jgi:uncharacterized protein YjbI with pentapeptide repeats